MKTKWEEMFEERAAIMEFDGGLTRAEAERRARAEVWKAQHAESKAKEPE